MHLKQTLHIPPWLFDTIVRIEEQDEDKILCIPIGGVRNLGKTTALIHIMRHMASKQVPDENNVRTLKFGILRETYSDFDQIIESFEEWFDHVEKYSDVKNCKVEGFSYKELSRSPRLVTYERTPDMLSLMLDGENKWDGTYTRILFRGFSYNRPGADARMRGWNLGSGWANEAQTLKEKPISTLMGAINRPTGKVKNSVLLVDFNLPERTDNGYSFLKKLISYDGDEYIGEEDESAMDIYYPKMPAPYYFEEDVDGKFTYEDRQGHLIPNPDFLVEAPHLTNLNNYAPYKILSDDEKRRNLLGEFGRASDGKLVYNEFDQRKHVCTVELPNEDDHPLHYILVAVDFGYNPGVIFSYVQDGTIKIFHEIVINNINFYELLTTYIVPYLQQKLPWFYNDDEDADQLSIKVIGDPTSGNQRAAIKSATPINVLLGKTDVNGDEDGVAERFHFVEAVPSPCGNVVEHRVQVSKQALTRLHGVEIDKSCKVLIDALGEEYTFGTTGKPKKTGSVLSHNAVDAFQYTCAYVSHALPTVRPPHKKRRRRNRNTRGKVYV